MAKTKEKILQDLRSFPGTKNKSESELERIAEETYKLNEIGIEELFSNKDEKKQAREFVKKYLKDWTPETVSELNDLKQLVYLEIVQFRLQNLMNSAQDKQNAVPLQMVDGLLKNREGISSLKDKLGVSRDSKITGQNDAFKVLQLLRKKFQVWLSNVDQASRTFACGYCGQLNLLRVKPNVWESQKHPFFRDRILGNEHLMRCYLNDKLTKEDVTIILECSSDYISWLIDKWRMDDNKTPTDQTTKVL
jgi:hypothetical protein